MTANGLSSSQPILDLLEGLLVENKEESRRVEFRVVTNQKNLLTKLKS